MTSNINNIHLPVIAITTEVDDDDDKNYNHLPVIDALTDVEDLIDDNLKENYVKRKTKRRKNKLMIRLNNDDANNEHTDLEDCEASDNEQDEAIVKHKKPISLDDLDLDTDVCEEIYKLNKNSKKLLTQHSTTKGSKIKNCLENLKEVHTDIEDYDTDCEITTPPVVLPDINLDTNLYNTIENVRENFQTNLQNSPMLTPIPSDVDDSKKKKRDTSLYLNIRQNDIKNLTDVEVLDTDSDNDYKTPQKKVKKRRPKGSLRNRGGVTDIEDVELSNEDTAKGLCLVKPKFKNFRVNKVPLSYLQQKSSQLYDSDNDDEILIRKKPKPPQFLSLPEKLQDDGLTDLENFDTDINLSDIDVYNYVDDELSRRIELFEDSCGLIKETSDVRRNHNQNKDQNCTDAEDYQTDDDLFKPIRCFDSKNVKICPINERKPKKIHRVKSITLDDASLLSVAGVTDDAVTDLESIHSSQEELNNPIYLAVANKLSEELTATDNEVFSAEEDMQNESLSVIDLPKAVRNLIIVRENRVGKPTAVVLPIDEERSFGLESAQFDDDVDVECDLEIESDLEFEYDPNNFLGTEQFIRAPTPTLPILEGGSVDAREKLWMPSRSVTPMEGILTDTESIAMAPHHGFRNKSKSQRPKQKYFLTVQNDPSYSNKTDVEDLYESDYDPSRSRLSICSITSAGNVEKLTDLENMNISDSDNDDGIIHFDRIHRPDSVTPIHMKEIGGGSVFVTESDGPFTSQDRLQVNCKNVKRKYSYANTPIPTDTEDFIASGDEFASISDTKLPISIRKDLEGAMYSNVHSQNMKKANLETSNEIIHSKMGTTRDVTTDIEDVTASEDDKSLNNDDIIITIKKSNSTVSLNWKDCSVSFGFNKGILYDLRNKEDYFRCLTILYINIVGNLRMSCSMLYVPMLRNVEIDLVDEPPRKILAKSILNFVKYFENFMQSARQVNAVQIGIVY